MIRKLLGNRRQREVTTYAALGDSFTAGNGCDPTERWSDLFADGLRASNPRLNYVNLARDGADSHDVLEQVPKAINHRPDLVTLVCGANDVILNLRPDIGSFSARLELMLDRLRRALPDAAILTATYPVGWCLEGIGPRTQARIHSGMTDLNLAIRDVSAALSVPCLDVVDHPGIGDPGNFESDGLHPSPAGHRHAAAEFRRAIAINFQIETTTRSA
ncbi:MAG: SGNH/GDSL hydrolase family protein [Thermoleophilia bacterium]|nr:SGNH/GDSL hydrolase family protein [Thermoleophilia bacterium]